MRQDLTDLNVLIDRSGSMSCLADSVREGVNELINGQKALEGDCNITVAQFDKQGSEVCLDYLIEGVSVEVVDNDCMAGYQPRGMTPLTECAVKFIDRIGERLSAMDEVDRPGKVIVVIQTDGHENSSNAEFTKELLAERVKHQEENYQWEFVFLGANVDAFAEGPQ